MQLLTLLVLPFLVAYVVISRAFVFTYLWTWFIMPFSESVPEVSLSWAVGLAMFVAYLTYDPDVHKDERETDVGKLVVFFIAPWITLAAAAVVHAIMT